MPPNAVKLPAGYNCMLFRSASPPNGTDSGHNGDDDGVAGVMDEFGASNTDEERAALRTQRAGFDVAA